MLVKQKKQICKDKKKYKTEIEATHINQIVYKCKICGFYHRSGKLDKLVRFIRKVSKGRKY